MSTEPSVQEFQSDRRLALLAGAATAFMGLTQVALTITFASQGVPILFGLAGALLLIISAAAFTYRSSVTIDMRTGRVLRSRGALGWSQEAGFSLREFKSVGIGMASRTRNYGRTSVSYFVQLLGATNLNLPGSFTNKTGALDAARRLAQRVHLPVDETPRSVFFGWRL